MYRRSRAIENRDDADAMAMRLVPRRKGVDHTFQPTHWRWRDDVEDRQSPHCWTRATPVEFTHPPSVRRYADRPR